MTGQAHGITAQLWRAVAVYRIVTLIYAGALLIRAHGSYAHPAAGLVVLAAMTVWTAFMTVAQLADVGRRALVVAADVAVCGTLTLTTMWIQTYEQSHGGSATLTTVWVASAVLGCALVAGPWGGAVGAALIGVCSFVTRGTMAVPTFNNIVLLFLAGVVSGYTIRLVFRAENQLSEATKIEAAARERDRLARSIHDGVLQVLAAVRQSGHEGASGRGAELGKLAGEQEVALRTLIRTQRLETDASPLAGETDLRALLLQASTTSVEVATPATPVLLEAGAAAEVDAAVRAALDNVSRHAGPDAKAWILLEDLGIRIVITVRDDGAGFAANRLDEAAGQGRLGVALSIRGRIEELGGSVSIVSAVGRGTEIEMDIPSSRSQTS